MNELKQINDLSGSLRELHAALLAGARFTYERRFGPMANSAEWLQIVMNDPLLEWLRPLSRLMADIDLLRDRSDLAATDAAAVRHEVERLIAPAPHEGGEFFARYLDALQDDAAAIVAHAAVRKHLAELPAGRPGDLDELRGARARWQAAARRTRGGARLH